MSIVILIIIFILILFLFKNKYENYDGRISNINEIEKCANIASSMYDVSAFGYDSSNNKCFVSKTSLSRPPIQVHPYHSYFKPTDIICNKVNYIRRKEDLYDKNNVISNRLYNCYINDSILKDSNSELIYFEKNKPKLKIDRQDVTKLPYTDETMFNIDWPTNIKELSEIDIVYRNNKILDIKWESPIDSIEKKDNPYELYEIDYGFKNSYNKCKLIG